MPAAKLDSPSRRKGEGFWSLKRGPDQKGLREWPALPQSTDWLARIEVLAMAVLLPFKAMHGTGNKGHTDVGVALF